MRPWGSHSVEYDWREVSNDENYIAQNDEIWSNNSFYREDCRIDMGDSRGLTEIFLDIS